MQLVPRRSSSGLTIIELMVVVGLLAMLATMAMVSVNRPRKTAQTTTCIASLTQLENVKQQWGLEHNKEEGDTPTLAELKPYFRFAPECPALGSYTLNPLGTKAVCSIAGHSL